MSFASVVDAGGLPALRAAAARGDAAALEEAAVHFEALFIGMLLESARSASLGEGLLDGADTRQYLEIMDSQVALAIARRGGFGFGRILVEQLGGTPAPPKIVSDTIFRGGRKMVSDTIFEGGDGADARQRFVRALLPHAERAAERLGVDPKLLVAQAALETGWGAAIPRRADGRSSHNLFGMKAGSSWRGPTAGAWTLEIVAGVPERRRADFRAYESIAESFADYADVIERLPRYADALRSGADPEAYARGIAAAGYATDPGYAEKWLAVYRSAAIADADRPGLARRAQESDSAADNGPERPAADHGSARTAAGETHEDPRRFEAMTAWMD